MRTSFMLVAPRLLILTGAVLLGLPKRLGQAQAVGQRKGSESTSSLIYWRDKVCDCLCLSLFSGPLTDDLLREGMELWEKKGLNRGLWFAVENQGAAKSAKAVQSRVYEAGARDLMSDYLMLKLGHVGSDKVVVPTLAYDAAGKQAARYVKADGFAVVTKTFIDRKFAVVNTDKSHAQIQRWAAAFKDNPGFKLEIQVPQQELARARAMIARALRLNPEYKTLITAVAK